MKNPRKASTMFNFLLTITIILSATFLHAKEIVLTQHNFVLLKGPITESNLESVIAEVQRLSALRHKPHQEPLYLVINSNGGELYSGTNSYVPFRKIKNLKTITIGAKSMASGIVQAIPGDRYITKTGVMMFHRTLMRLPRYLYLDEMQELAKGLEKLSYKMESVNVARMKMSMKKYKQLIKNEIWLLGQDAVDFKAADAVVDLKCLHEVVECPLNQEQKGARK